MLSPKIRWVIVALLLVSGMANLIMRMDWLLTIALWLTAGLLVISHFRFGTIIGVLRALSAGNIPKAKELLAAIKRPQWLGLRYQAYYHFASGVIALHEKNFEEGEVQLSKGLDLGLPGDHEQAISYLNLAHIAYVQKEKQKAEGYVLESKQRLTAVNDLFLKKRLEELEEVISKLPQNASLT